MKTILKPTLLLALGRLGAILLAAVQLILIARLPSKTAGVILLHSSLWGALGVGIDMGTGQALLRALSLEEKGKKLSLTGCMWINTALALRLRLGLCAMVIYLFYAWSQGDLNSFSVLAASIHLPVQALGAGAPVFLIQKKALPLIGSRLAGFILSLGVTALLFFNNYTEIGPYLCAQGAGTVLSMIILWKMTGLSIKGPRFPIKRILPETMLLGMGNFIRFLYYQGDQILVRLIAPGELHLYCAPYRVFSAALVLPQSLGEFLLAPLTKDEKNTPALAEKTRKRLSIHILIIGLIPLGLAFIFAGPLVTILFGEEYGKSKTVLRILLVAALFVHPASVLITHALAAGRLKAVLVMSLAGLAATLLLCLLLVPALGAMGAAWATAGTEGLILILAFLMTRKRSR